MNSLKLIEKKKNDSENVHSLVLTAVPVLQEKDHVFTPSREEILEGQKLFIPSVNNKITFLKSALLTEQLPEHDLPEVNDFL